MQELYSLKSRDHSPPGSGKPPTNARSFTFSTRSNNPHGIENLNYCRERDLSLINILLAHETPAVAALASLR